MSLSEAARSEPRRSDVARATVQPRFDVSRVAVLAVAALMLVGIAIRVEVARQSFFGDELATYWIITTRGLGGLISALYATHDEITPPLFFVGAWLTAHISHLPVLIRAPSLVAGALTIPSVYLLGARTVGSRAGVIAAALTTFSPFMIYYSAEARAYALMMLLVTLSTISMLLALDSGRARWWIAYAVCSAAAFYTHYTCAFYLIAQLGWLLWAHPEARVRALLASAGALVAVLPWAPAAINAAGSPTTKIMSALAPFSLRYILQYLEHWAIGYPYTGAAGLSELPGVVALVLLSSAIAVAIAGQAARARRASSRLGLGQLQPRTILIAVLLLSVPVGEGVVSGLSTHVFGVRNLASAWPALALASAAVAVSAGSRLRIIVAVLSISAFAIAAAKMLDPRFQRPDFAASATYVDRTARPGDVVIDDTRGAPTPGPLTGLDVFLHAKLPIFRAGVPQERDHPFGFGDPVVPLPAAIREAVATAGRGRIFVVNAIPTGQSYARVAARRLAFPARYRLIAYRVNPGIVGTAVQIYSSSP